MMSGKLYYYTFFPFRPRQGTFCSSRHIGQVEATSDAGERPYLVVVRAGSKHCIIGLEKDRNFDLALNHYATPAGGLIYEYRYAGGVSKYKAAAEFLQNSSVPAYRGYMFMDDDLSVSTEELCRFFEYCESHELGFAQPSLSVDSFYTYQDLIKQPGRDYRQTPLVEVMMPFFSYQNLKAVVETFPKSISTYGLDVIWPYLIVEKPVVVDACQVAHIREMGTGNFYTYLRKIGVDLKKEHKRLINEYVETA